MINLQPDNPALLIHLPKVVLIMERVLALNETFYFAGPHLFFGAYYGSRPTTLGGDFEKAKYHLQRAIVINNGKFLMANLLLALYYAVPLQNQALFEQTLNDIVTAPPDLFPAQGLANAIAKKQAQFWLQHNEDLFF